MDIDLALLADAATVDGAGKLNILGVFDRITASEFPAKHGRLCLVVRFVATLVEAGPHEVQIELRGPEGEEVLRLDGQMNLAPGPVGASAGIRVPQVLNMDGLVFQRPGRYSFDVAVDDEHHVSIPLHVVESGARAMA